MSTTAIAADGSQHVFPDGTSPAVIDRAMKGYAAQQQQGANPIPQFLSHAADAIKNSADPVMRALGIPANDATRNIAALATTGKPLYQAPKPTTLPAQYAATLGDYSIAAAAPGSLPQRIAQAVVPGLASETAGQLTQGTPLEPLARIAGGIAGGAAVSAAPGVAAAARGAAKPQKLPIPSLDELQQSKNAAYAAADQAGVRYAPQSVQAMAAGVDKALQDADIDAELNPKASRALQILKDRAANGQLNSLSDIDRVRKIVSRNVMSSNDPAEQFMGQKIINGIDDFINGATPQDVVAGDPQQAAEFIGNARALNTRFMKMDALQEALKNAEFTAARSGSGGNVDNATRQALDRLRKSITNWTPDEEQALEQAIKGNGAQNLLRLLGKASPEGNGLMQVLNMGEAVHSGGASLPMTIGATLAKRAADRMTQAHVDNLLSLVGNGGATPPAPSIVPPQLRAPATLPPAIAAIMGGAPAAAANLGRQPQ
jgi:hypothetical protein